MELREKLDENEILLQQTMAQIHQSIEVTNHNFANLANISNQLRAKFIAEMQRVTLENRITIIISVIIIFLAMVIGGYYLINIISRSLSLLIHAMKNIVRNESGLEHRLELTKFSELNAVVDSFNHMASDLQFT